MMLSSRRHTDGRVPGKKKQSFFHCQMKMNLNMTNYRIFQKFLWFPKLYKNGEWDNSISEDENIIIEKCLNPEKLKRHIEKNINEKEFTRIVFARVKSPLGDIMYRYKGEYKLDTIKTSKKNGSVLYKISDIVKTYKFK